VWQLHFFLLVMVYTMSHRALNFNLAEWPKQRRRHNQYYEAMHEARMECYAQMMARLASPFTALWLTADICRLWRGTRLETASFAELIQAFRVPMVCTEGNDAEKAFSQVVVDGFSGEGYDKLTLIASVDDDLHMVYLQLKAMESDWLEITEYLRRVLVSARDWPGASAVIDRLCNDSAARQDLCAKYSCEHPGLLP
jgi:hypothetical protein